MVQNHYRCRCLPLPYFSHCYDECDTSSSRRLHKQSVSNIAEYCCNIAKRVSCKEFGKKLAQDYPQDCCCKNLVKKNACSCKATSNILRKKVAQESCSWKAGLTLLNISKHRPEQSDCLQPTAALPSMLKLIITEYSETIVTE